MGELGVMRCVGQTQKQTEFNPGQLWDLRGWGRLCFGAANHYSPSGRTWLSHDTSRLNVDYYSVLRIALCLALALLELFVTRLFLELPRVWLRVGRLSRSQSQTQHCLSTFASQRPTQGHFRC
jgi:hypothetical protein